MKEAFFIQIRLILFGMENNPVIIESLALGHREPQGMKQAYELPAFYNKCTINTQQH